MNEFTFWHTEWRHNAKVCAKALRKYADKYHPVVKRTGIPPSILAIFKEKALVAFSLIVTVFGVIHK